MTADTLRSPITSTLGETLSVQDWPLPSGLPTRGTVVLVHGLGEHIGCYAELANCLNRWGFAVRGYDQYGHGEASGTRGDLPQPDQLLDDLASVIDDTRVRMDDRLPLLLLGHGLGGLIAAQAVSTQLRQVDGLVLSSPALAVHVSLWQYVVLRVLKSVAPQWRLDNRVHPADLTHDLDAVEAFRNDGLRHGRMSARLGHYIYTQGSAVRARAPHWQTPTLLLYAGQDASVDPAGSQQFAQAAPAGWVTAHRFPMHFHALFHELERQPIYDTLQQWLWARYPTLALDQPVGRSQLSDDQSGF